MNSPDRSIDPEEEIQALYNALDERDRIIEQLEEELERGHHDSVLALQEENQNQLAELEKNRDDLIQCRDTVADLQIQLKQLRSDNRDLIEEKDQLEEDLTAHKSQLDTQRSLLAHHAKSSEDAKRQNKDGNQQLQRLELENQRLRATIIEIEENEDILVNEIETLVKENSAHQERSEDLSSKCDSLFADLDEKTRINSDLLQEKKKLQSDLEREQAAHAISESEWKQRDADCRLEITKLKEEIEREREKHKSILQGKEYESNKIELGKARHENERLLSAFHRCTQDKNQAERDLDSAIAALNQAKVNQKEEVALAVRKERGFSAELKRNLDKATEKEKSLLIRCSDLEEQLEDVHKQLNNSEERNSRYEENHGLSDAVRHQKKLEADLRRRDYDLKQLHLKLSKEMEGSQALAKAVMLIREKASFEFDDEEIQSAVNRADNTLRSENAELLRQVEALEAERTRLLTQLRERAIEIGEKTRFLGMCPQQIALVMEFASNIKCGKTDLPLNDKSKELIAQITSLKSEREVDKATIERLEREIFCLSDERSPISVQGALQNDSSNNKDNNNEINTSILTPAMQDRAREILGESLVSMPAAAEVQFMCLLEQFQLINSVPTNNKEQDTTNIDDTRQALLDLNASEESATERNTNRDQILVALSHIQDFRRGTFLANEKNRRLRDMVAASERVIRELRTERDELSHVTKVLLSSKSDAGSNDERGEKMSATSSVQLAAKCKMLQDDLEREKQYRKAVAGDGALSEMAKRIAYLESWKDNAMRTIENQLKSLQKTVSKSSYVEALNEVDNLKRDNAFLVDRTAVAHVCLMRYQEIIKSLGCCCEEDEGGAVVSGKKENTAMSSVTTDDRIKALSAENSLLYQRIVAYEEREQCMKSKMDGAVAILSKFQSKFAGGMTGDETSKMQKEFGALKSELAKAQKCVREYKKIMDMSSHASLSVPKRDENGEVIPPTSRTHSQHIDVVELEHCESKLSEAHNQVLDLQNTCKALLHLVQRVTKNNWYEHAPINQIIFREDSLKSDVMQKETDHIAISAASKIKILIDAMENLRQQVNDNENSLEQMIHEKELLETKLSQYQSSNILNSRSTPKQEVFQQLLESKSKLFSVQRELRQVNDQKRILETKNELLERSNLLLEHDAANADLLHITNQSSISSSVLGPLLSLQAADDIQEEHSKTNVALQQAIGSISRYTADLRGLYSKYSSIQTTRLEASKVLDQVECLKDVVAEKNRVIAVLKEKLAQITQANLKPTRPPLRHKQSDESVSTFGTIGSIANLAKASPKRGVYESRIEEAARLLALKDQGLEKYESRVQELNNNLASVEEAYQRLSRQLEDERNQSKLQKTDISTLVSNLSDKESEVMDMQNTASIQKQIHQETKDALASSLEENAKLKAKLIKQNKERKETDSRISNLEADIERSKRILSVARQGRARSESTLKEESIKASSAQEEVAKLSAEVNDLKAKMIAATEDKVAANKKARAAVARLKSIKTKFDPETHEKVVGDLEKRVAVLNQTVSGLASQNSKLRSELTKQKRENESGQEDTHPSTSNERPGSRARCRDCKSMKERVAFLEQSLSNEKKHRVDSQQMLEMYRARSYNLEESQDKRDSERSLSSSADGPGGIKSKVLELSKENEKLREEIRQAQIMHQKEAKEKSMLEKENKRMSSQLEAFDLDFFEEIEDLKYKYNEAVRQLNELTSES